MTSGEAGGGATRINVIATSAPLFIQYLDKSSRASPGLLARHGTVDAGSQVGTTQDWDWARA